MNGPGPQPHPPCQPPCHWASAVPDVATTAAAIAVAATRAVKIFRMMFTSTAWVLCRTPIAPSAPRFPFFGECGLNGYACISPSFTSERRQATAAGLRRTAMSLTDAIGHIHGGSDKLPSLLLRCETHSEGRRAAFVIGGDYIHRG